LKILSFSHFKEKQNSGFLFSPLFKNSLHVTAKSVRKVAVGLNGTFESKHTESKVLKRLQAASQSA
jgi:hypothetical protein